jgi:hypothetical protein
VTRTRSLISPGRTARAAANASAPSPPAGDNQPEPLRPVVVTFQRAIYNRTTVNKGTLRLLPEVGAGSHLLLLTLLLAVSLIFLGAAMAFFRRVEGSFAEEL